MVGSRSTAGVRTAGHPPYSRVLLGEQGNPGRHAANYHRTTDFHGCYSVGADTLWGINRRRKGISFTWAVLRTIRAARPDGAPIYVVMDNLCAHRNWRIRRWAKKNKVELCFTPTNASWANPIEAHCGPLRRTRPGPAGNDPRLGVLDVARGYAVCPAVPTCKCLKVLLLPGHVTEPWTGQQQTGCQGRVAMMASCVRLRRRCRRGAATVALRPQRQGGNKALPSAARFQGAESILKPR